MSIWHRQECGDGRAYQLAKNIHIKYDDHDTIIARIMDGLREFITIEAAVRITCDTPKCNPEKAVLAIPFRPAEEELVFANFATTIFQSLMGYYISADPRTTHFGITNAVIEGEMSSLVRREMEKLFYQFQHRDDLTGRLLRNVYLVGESDVPQVGDNYMIDAMKEGVDIHVGFRILAKGTNVHASSMFVPVESGQEIIDVVYYNLEQLLHQNFVAYDESGDGYLTVTDTLIYKELCGVLQRAKIKENTRKKILNNLQFTTIFTEDPVKLYGGVIGDSLYDTINKIQEPSIRAATERSRELFVSNYVRSTEITTNSVDGDIPMKTDVTYVPASRPAASTATRVPGRERVKSGGGGKGDGIASRLALRRDSFQEL